MTRTAEFGRGHGSNIIPFPTHTQREMETRRYILVPVVEDFPETPQPRRHPRRASRRENCALFFHTLLDVVVIAVTLVFSLSLVGMI